MQSATEFQNGFGLNPQPDGAVGHEREAHAVAWLHAEAVPYFLGDGDLALAGEGGVGGHGEARCPYKIIIEMIGAGAKSP